MKFIFQIQKGSSYKTSLSCDDVFGSDGNETTSIQKTEPSEMEGT